jgi:Zn-dependent protease
LGNFDNFLHNLAIIGPMLLFSVVAHEIAHGYAALKQGDPTAYQLGRLTWNPIKHIDPFFTIILPLVMMLAPGGGIIGGAKPVPVNPRNYRNFKRGDIIVSLAGVATNGLISIGCIVAIAILGGVARAAPSSEDVVEIAQGILVYGVVLNWILIVFNLLPIPPLDGSHVMKYLLPPAWSLQYSHFGARFGFLILIVLVVFAPGALGTLLSPAFLIADLLLRTVEALILPGFREWLPR